MQPSVVEILEQMIEVIAGFGRLGLLVHRRFQQPELELGKCVGLGDHSGQMRLHLGAGLIDQQALAFREGYPG